MYCLCVTATSSLLWSHLSLQKLQILVSSLSATRYLSITRVNRSMRLLSAGILDNASRHKERLLNITKCNSEKACHKCLVSQFCYKNILLDDAIIFVCMRTRSQVHHFVFACGCVESGDHGCGQAEYLKGCHASCIAFKSVYDYCGRVGHYSSVCLQKPKHHQSLIQTEVATSYI